jgi:hypothetical protein
MYSISVISVIMSCIVLMSEQLSVYRNSSGDEVYSSIVSYNNDDEVYSNTISDDKVYRNS